MPNYKKLYHKIFNKVTDVIEELQQLQIETEEEYINSLYDERKTIKLVQKDKEKNF
jgi:hypothetical protein